MAIESEAVKQFAVAQRVKTRVDVDETPIIPGKFGQIYEHDEDVLAVMFMPKVKPEEPVLGWKRKWTHWRESCVEAGMELQQNGDWEGSLTFDPKNQIQCRLAVRVAGIKRKRVLSPESLEALGRKGAIGLQRAASLRNALSQGAK
jgi:hypothetical protein